MLSGSTDSEDIRPVELENPVRPEDIRVLNQFRSLDEIETLVRRYAALDVPKEHPVLFQQHLMQRRDAWFLEVGDVGLVYITGVVPRQSGILNVLFWDGKLRRDRREAVKSIVSEAFELFALERLSAMTPIPNSSMRNMYQKVGFVLEGVIRNGWREDKELQDLVLFGMLRKEKPCPVLKIPALSSAQA